MNYAAAASSIGADAPERTYGHNRPRTIFLRGNREINDDDIWNALITAQATRQYISSIEAFYNIRQGVWILAMKDVKKDGIITREQLLQETGDGIMTNNGNIKFELPRKKTKHLVIRGIPTESNKTKVTEELNKCDIGIISNMTRIYRRNTAVYSGNTNVWVEDYKPKNLQKTVSIEGYICRIYEVDTTYKKKCGNCLREGHVIRECKEVVVCRKCKKPGHKQVHCPGYHDVDSSQPETFQKPLSTKHPDWFDGEDAMSLEHNKIISHDSKTSETMESESSVSTDTESSNQLHSPKESPKTENSNTCGAAKIQKTPTSSRGETIQINERALTPFKITNWQGQLAPIRLTDANKIQWKEIGWSPASPTQSNKKGSNKSETDIETSTTQTGDTDDTKRPRESSNDSSTSRERKITKTSLPEEQKD